VSAEVPFRVRLRYAAFDTFIEKFAPNVTRGGVFLASKSPFPVGTTFAFEIQLAGGEPALVGEGKVTWVKPFDPAAPQKAHGMGVQFLSLDAPSREMLNQILARKAATAAGVVRAPIGITASSGSHLTSSQRTGSRTGSYRTGSNGVPSGARVDTTVDLASELGVDETRLRRATDRARLAAGRATAELDELEALLKPDPVEPMPGIAQALAELPRLIDSPARRVSVTGSFRPPAEPAAPAASEKPADAGTSAPVPQAAARG
jgi:uncharacterized protein (TIGR02266 family)